MRSFFAGQDGMTLRAHHSAENASSLWLLGGTRVARAPPGKALLSGGSVAPSSVSKSISTSASASASAKSRSSSLASTCQSGSALVGARLLRAARGAAKRCGGVGRAGEVGWGARGCCRSQKQTGGVPLGTLRSAQEVVAVLVWCGDALWQAPRIDCTHWLDARGHRGRALLPHW